MNRAPKLPSSEEGWTRLADGVVETIAMKPFKILRTTTPAEAATPPKQGGELFVRK